MGNAGPEKAVIGLSVSIGVDMGGTWKMSWLTIPTKLKQKEQR